MYYIVYLSCLTDVFYQTFVLIAGVLHLLPGLFSDDIIPC